ncbi:alpha/beta hydrolase [Microbulbifer sp. ZGT114]|nr:alpha/beta hydrolase [Microbulbifer sp. ZGT114]
MKALLLVITLPVLAACNRGEPADGDADPESQLQARPCWFEADNSWPITQCFMMEVPENHEKPQGRKIRFPVVRFMANDQNPDKFPLLHLGAGGPGASMGLEPENASEWLWINYATMTVENGRDLIVIDPRGTGMAEPRLACTEFIEDATTAFQRPLTADEEARVFSHSLERCYSRLSEKADLAHYNSSAVAQDIEALRKALGVEQMNLYGVSYASRYALTLARDFPDSVRALVLNSAVFPDIPYIQQLAEDSQSAYFRGLNFCSEDKLCASRYPNLRQRLESLVEKLDEAPVTVPIEHPYADGEFPFAMTGQRLLRVLFQALYDEGFYPELPAVIEGLEKGDPAPARDAVNHFMAIILDPYFGDAAGISHFCFEEAPFVDFEEARRKADDTGILGSAVRADLELMQLQCRIWAIPPAGPLEAEAIAAEVPTLILHGALDPVLDAEDAEKARAALPNHQWLLFPQLAHDVISASNCAEEAAAKFLDDPAAQVSEQTFACRKEELALQAGEATEAQGEAEHEATPRHSPPPVIKGGQESVPSPAREKTP